MINILYVNLEFPPLNSAGVFRALKFANSFDKSKFNIDILCFSDQIYSGYLKDRKIDYELLEEINKKVNVLNLVTEDLFFLCSNYTKNIVLKNLKLKKEIQNLYDDISIKGRGKYDIIISSIPYSAAAFIGLRLKKLFHSKHVLDLRDDWSGMPTQIYSNWFRFVIKYMEEKYAINNSDIITTVTRPLMYRYKKRHRIKTEKIKYLPNSINVELKVKNKLPKNKEAEIVKIGYTGSFYFNAQLQKLIDTPFYKRGLKDMLKYTPLKEDWLYRTPFFFFKLMKEFNRKNKKTKIVFHYIGNEPKWLKLMATNYGIIDMIEFHGFQSKNKVKIIQNQWDAFLITSEKVENSEHYCIPSKIFDYMNYNIPIIGVTTKGPVSNIIVDNKLGIVIDADSWDEKYIEFEDFILNLSDFEIPSIIDLIEYDLKKVSKQFEKILISLMK